LVVPVEIKPGHAVMDDPGAALEQHGAVPLAKSHPSHRRGQAPPDVSRRLAPRRPDRRAVASSGERGAATPRVPSRTGYRGTASGPSPEKAPAFAERH